MSLLREVKVVVLEEERRLFRVCGARGAGGFLDALRSHYELDRPPRGPENRAAAIHMALSMFDAAVVARDLALRVPKLGGHLAAIDLRPGLGICVAKTGGPEHGRSGGGPSSWPSASPTLWKPPTCAYPEGQVQVL